MTVRRRSPVLVALSIAVGLLGLAMAVAGAWLAWLGGSWYYVLAGLVLLLVAALLWRGRPAALWLYAAFLLATLGWSLWEVGLDWWALAPRGDVWVILGVLLVLPFVGRRLLGDASMVVDGALVADPSTRNARAALGAALVVSVAVAAASWFTDPHAVEGTTRGPEVGAVPADGGVPEGEWHAYGRTGHGQRFTPLGQITPENVDRLEVAWTYNTGDVSRPGDPEETTFQATPLKIGDVLYLCTPHQSVIALDAVTGREVWRVDPGLREGLALQHLTCRGLSHRPPTGAGTGGGNCDAMLYMPTADGRLLALDPETGAACRNFADGGELDLWQNMPNVRPGAYYSTSPVVVARDLVVVGGTVLDNVSTEEASGVIRAFEAGTGRQVWAFDTGAPDDTAPPAPGETYTANSPNSWSISSVDADLGLVYVPLGNQPPDQYGGDRSPEVERFSSSVVALDLATGEVRWVFQTVHHDLWDYDVPSQPTLVDVETAGGPVPALVQPTKQGDIYVLDRRTGEPILPVAEVPAPQGAVEGDFTAPTQPVSAMSYEPPVLDGRQMWGLTPFDQLACRIRLKQLRYEGRYTPPSLEGTIVHPGNFGVFNWGGVAVDPTRQLVIGSPAYLAFVSQMVPRPDDTTLMVQGDERPEGSLPALNENFGAPYAVKLSPFLSFLGLPCQQPPWGYVSAADLATGEVVWMHRNGTVRDMTPLPLPFRMGVPDLGGPLATASGVFFLSGTLDYFIRAYDVTTGRELWRDRLPAGGQATPMSYMGADGRQYVVVAAGGHGSLGTKRGDAVIAWALPPES